MDGDITDLSIEFLQSKRNARFQVPGSDVSVGLYSQKPRLCLARKQLILFARNFLICAHNELYLVAHYFPQYLACSWQAQRGQDDKEFVSNQIF
jgi:hypothetical protein